MQAFTLTVDAGSVRLALDLVDGAGPEEIQAGLETLLGVVRSARFRALVAASAQFMPSRASVTLNGGSGGSPARPPLGAVVDRSTLGGHELVTGPEIDALVSPDGSEFPPFDVAGPSDVPPPPVSASASASVADPAVVQLVAAGLRHDQRFGLRVMVDDARLRFGCPLPAELMADYGRAAGISPAAVPVGHLHPHKPVVLNVEVRQVVGENGRHNWRGKILSVGA